MTTRIAGTNIQNATITGDDIASNTITTTNLNSSVVALLGGSSPTVTQIQITDSSYNVLDDTAVANTGGYIKITGTNFTAGSQVVIGSVAATSVGFVSSTTLNVQVPAQAAGTYVVYVTTNTGSVAILVNGLTYSGTPTWVTGSTLTGGQVDSAISIQLSATGDAPLTYTLQAGSSLPAGLTLTSGGLLSGTVTGITVETTYNFTIEAIDAQAQESPRAFSITISSNDQYFEYVTSLLSAATPASTFVTDASTNSFVVTANGDARPNNFGPYTPGYYSVQFNGSSNYLSVPNSTAMNFMSSNYTVEAWVYPTATPGATYGFGVFSNTSGSDGWLLRLQSTLQFALVYPGVVSNSFGPTISLNAWTHVAIVRNGTAVTGYINGIGYSITSTTPAETNRAWTIGYGYNDYFNGFISNLRVVKGTAVYTSNFTPSTTPLTAVANTSLLTCQSNRFIDNSTNALTITPTGTPVITGFDPFVPSSSYSSYGSTYFDGTGDYLDVINSSTCSNFGTSDFTVEGWFYLQSSASQILYDFRTGPSDAAGALYYSGTNINWYVSGADRITGSALALNQWYHIAVARSGTSTKLFVNGSQVGSTYTDTTNYIGNTNRPRMGFLGDGTGTLPFAGYMSNLRVVKGTAVYTTTFTTPTTPLTAVANTSLLTCQSNQPNNNSMFLDSSTNNFTITRAGNTTQGAFSPYGGGWSNYFDGTGDWLTVPYSVNLVPGSGDFTIEMWFYTTNGSTRQDPYSMYTSTTGIGVSLSLTNSRDIVVYNGDTTLLATAGSVWSANTWNHLAVSRSGTTLRIFLNGTQVGTTTNSTNITGSTTQYIGAAGNGTLPFTGYLSNVRFVKGTAVYTSNFTPSTAPLTPIANTQLLTCADNRFIDDSPNNFAITRNGDVSVQRFNPFNPVITTPTSYGAYFDGTGDSLSFTPNSSFAFGTGNFTVECWYYPTSAVTSEYLIDNRNASQLATWVLTYNWTGSNSGTLYWYNGSTALGQISGSTITNAWNHIAYVRSGTTGSLYINGTRVATQTDSTNYSNTPLSSKIGDRYVNTGADQYAKGYISNFRVVNGTAVYDPSQTTLTVPTSPLTAIANTSLLTLQSATFVDNSTNNFTITANGDAAPRQFNPFGWTSTTGGSAAYTPALYGGSGYFDGTGDSLSLTNNAAFNLSSGDFTVECWVYRTGDTGAYYEWIVGKRATGGGYTWSWSLQIGSNNKFSFYNNVTEVVSTTTAILNTWYHVAAVRQSGTLRLYVNGVQEASSGSYPINEVDTPLTIGNYPVDNPTFTGYMSDLRIVKGTAVYTSNFQPPVAPLTAQQNTVLLNNMTGAGIYDSSMITTYETVGNSGISTSLKKYGNTSMYFDGTGDYLIAPASQNFVFGTGDFTIECWLYLTALGLDDGVIIELRSSGATSNGFVFNTRSSGGGYVLNFYTDSAPNLGSTVLSLNAWNHVAVTRSGSTVQLFSNGAVSATITKSNNFSNSPNPTIGQSLIYGNSNITGYIDDLRITKGVARYTSSFSPPASPVIRF